MSGLIANGPVEDKVRRNDALKENAMGYNSTVVILNDALHVIETDPEFGKRLADAVKRAVMGKPVDVAAHSASGGIYCNAATVIETHHADYDVLVRVGGNRGEVIRDA